MPDTYEGAERREFFRYRFEKPVRYRMLNVKQKQKIMPKLMNAVSKNLSASGILFSTKTMPKLSSLLVLDLDYRTAQICQEIEENALINDNKLFGKVVRIEENDSGLYDVGVAFVKKFDNLTDTIKKMMV